MNETDRGAEAAVREYFTAIETEFIRRRGSPFLLSPKDFALIRRWRDLGIPAADVCRGIADAFDRRAERAAVSKINSVAYCEGAILEAWERNASARVGRAPDDPRELDVPAALEPLAAALSDAAVRRPEAAEAISRAVRSVRKLQASGRGGEEVERSLSRLEKKLLKEVAGSIPADELSAIEMEADGRLAGDHETMEPGAFAKTREILIRRSLRADLGLPRLSLLG